jgi:hypothetical protein
MLTLTSLVRYYSAGYKVVCDPFYCRFRRPAALVDDGSVRLARIAGVEIRLTPINTIFILMKVRGKASIFWPSLKGTSLWVESPEVTNLRLPKPAADKVLQLLLTQKKVREENALDWDEDEAVYTYS